MSQHYFPPTRRSASSAEHEPIASSSSSLCPRVGGRRTSSADVRVDADNTSVTHRYDRSQPVNSDHIYIFPPSAPSLSLSSNPPSPYSSPYSPNGGDSVSVDFSFVSSSESFESPDPSPVRSLTGEGSGEYWDEWDDNTTPNRVATSSSHNDARIASLVAGNQSKQALETWPALSSSAADTNFARRLERIRSRERAFLREHTLTAQEGSRRSTVAPRSCDRGRAHDIILSRRGRRRFRSRSWNWGGTSPPVDGCDAPTILLPRMRHLPLLTFFAALLRIDDSTLRLFTHSVPQSVLFPPSRDILSVILDESASSASDGESFIVWPTRLNSDATVSLWSDHGVSTLRDGCAMACDSSLRPTNPFTPPSVSTVLSLVGSTISVGGKVIKSAWNHWG